MFLLDLASTSGSRLTGDESFSTSGPWAVGKFKCLDSLEAPAACKELLQSDTCSDALLQQFQDCDSAGVRIYSSQTFDQRIFLFLKCFSAIVDLVRGPRCSRWNRDAELSSVCVNGHREVTAETPRHDQPSKAGQQRHRSWCV